jgi:hypothetical protein
MLSYSRPRFRVAFDHCARVSSRSARSRRPTGRKTIQSQTSELLAWAKKDHATRYQPKRPRRPRAIKKLVIKTSAVISPTQWPPRTSCFSQATVAATDTDHTAATPIVTSPARPNVSLLDIRQRFQSARTRMATLSSDIRQYFSQASPAVPLLNPLDINKQSCTRIDKPQSRSRGHTCHRSRVEPFLYWNRCGRT